ncbi:MAG: glutaredoxin family protein [Pseudomonadales bacterium]|uniref:Glutaredoxin n=1 Tax=Oleiphilus messinensis TaxID=141451 RepID=A0A1Y0ICN1_9GAMM|nr:glutaredoxin family protein [Oleiphilus messinensis]ARU57144.1 glutaredoxin [Oleiphilus messinensis]MCG8613613.1 glutaredoxin family protein [Pseudomonadales bacterium]
MQPEIILYTTLGCHLCEQAEQVLREVNQHLPIQWTKKDIADDDQLVERYGIRIPVLYVEGYADDLGWPFAPDDLIRWLKSDTNTIVDSSLLDSDNG